MTDFAIPSSDATVIVKAINAADNGAAPAPMFLQPVLPGYERLPCAFFSFLIEHPTNGTRLMFDLGVRKDVANFAPPIAALFEAGAMAANVQKDVPTILEEGGVSLGSIKAVIWSHSHFDHIGDMSIFPPTTELIVGPGTDTKVFPEGSLVEGDIAGRTVTELSFETSTLTIGGFQAIDYFADGSLYILNVPGHLPGHIAALARVTPTTFVLCAGDTCHHPGQLRPTSSLRRHFPCPGAIVAESRTTFSHVHFSHDGVDLALRSQPLLSIPDGQSFYADPVTSKVSLNKLEDFDANPNIFVLISHDISVGDVVEQFPESINDWKAKKYKERATWAFAEKENPAFRFSLNE